MTTIPPIGATSETLANQATTNIGPQTLDYEAFLQLLVTQMQNQDPLEPVSDTEYIAQLATFSNVEQNILTNDRLAAMITANQLGDAEGLIGRTVTHPDGTTGEVEAVTITADGNLARLVGGAEVVIGEGVEIS